MAAAASGASMSSTNHIPVEAWLQVLDLQEYTNLFQAYRGVEEMLELTESEVRDLGVKNSAHRARIVTSLVVLREKRHKRLRTNKPGLAATTSQQAAVGDYSHAHQESPLYQPFNQVKMLQSSHHVTGAQTEAGVTTEMLKQPWYHGNISRQKAEKLVVKNSDFLVRDSASQLGDYVLTCFWQNGPLHFVINRHVVPHPKTGQLLVQYQFEDGLFSSVPALIEHYRSTRKPVSMATGALLGNPVVRNVLLEYYDSRQRSMSSSPGSSPSHSPQLSRRRVARRAGSFDLLLDDERRREEPDIRRQGSQPSLHVDSSFIDNKSQKVDKMTAHVAEINAKTRCKRTGSEPLLSPGHFQTNLRFFEETPSHDTDIKGNENTPPPPKPGRIPTIKRDRKPQVAIRNKQLYEDDGKDYSDYEQVKSWPSSLQRTEDVKRQTCPSRDLSPEVRKAVLVSPNSSARVTAVTQGDYDIPKSRGNKSDDYDVPKSSPSKRADSSLSNLDMFPSKLPKQPLSLPTMPGVTTFDLSGHCSDYLTPQNKPLEPSALATMKMILKESAPKKLAQHITFLDLDLLKVMGHHDLGLGVHSGLELITLPQGQQLRQDILERFHCLRYYVAVITLVCTKLPERASILLLWIQVAMELRSSMGDLYGFSAIMAGLQCEQVSRLSATWHQLQHSQASTYSIFTKLRGLLLEMNQAVSTLPLQNITVPHITPLLTLMETPQQPAADLDLDTTLGHLDIARLVTEQCGLYRVTSESLMQGFRAEREILDLFRTETHLKVLWGWRGCGVSAKERYPKFEQLLTVLSEKAEPNKGETSL